MLLRWKRKKKETPIYPRSWALCCVYLALALASEWSWEPAHDEGITWLQTFGPLEIPRWPEPAAPVAALYATLEGADLAGREPRSAGDVVDALSLEHGMHPPAYYLLLHVWTAVFGGSALSLRLPAVLAGLLTLLGVRRLGERLVGGGGAGRWAMGLLALSPWFVTFSSYARPYALALCVAIAAQNAVLAIHPRPGSPQPGARPYAAFTALSILGVYLIYHYVFVLGLQLAQLAWLSLRAADRGAAARVRALFPVAGVALGVAIGFAPWLPRLLAHLELTRGARFYFGGIVAADDWIGGGVQLLACFALGEALWTPDGGWLLAALAVLSFATLAPPLLRVTSAILRPHGPSARERGLGDAPDPAVRAVWLSIPLLPALIAAADLWHGTHTLFFTKTGFALLPLLLLMIVRAWSAVRQRAVRVAGLLAWAVLFGAATTSEIAYRAASASPYEAAAAWLAERDDDAHLVLVSSLLPGVTTPFVLTLRDAGVRNVRVGVVGGDVLARVVEEEAARGTYRRVTLVDLEVPDVHDGRQRFGPRQLADAAKAARRAGWSVERPASGGVHDGGPTTSVPVLSILGPLRGRSLRL